MNNYIFDLDGTIVNSSKEVLLCFKKAFEKTGYKVDEARLTSNVIGPPLRGIISLIAPELQDEKIIESVIHNFRQFYDYDENDITEMYEGIHELLLRLKNSGKKLFVATFKPKIPTFRILKKFGLDMFDDVYTIDKFEKHITKEEMIADILSRYSLDKNETVMLGDAPSDVIAAKNCSVTAAGALWGYGEDKTPLIQNADFCITLEELDKLEGLAHRV